MEPVYYKIEDVSFPSESPEGFGYWVGIAEHVGHAMTYKIWSKKSGKSLHRSEVRSALHEDKPNIRIDPFYDSDHDTTTHPDTSRVLTDKDYGEKESGRPPDKEPDFIFSTKDKDKDKDSPQLTYGEKAYLIEGSSTERNNDVMVPTDEVCSLKQ